MTIFIASLVFVMTLFVIAAKIELVGQPINVWNCLKAFFMVICAFILLVYINIVAYNII